MEAIKISSFGKNEIQNAEWYATSIEELAASEGSCIGDKGYLLVENMPMYIKKSNNNNQEDWQFIGNKYGGGASSWNDLTDKPFYDSPTGGDTLTWDGNTEGLLSVVLYEEDDYREVAYKVSDSIVTISDLVNGATYKTNAGRERNYSGDDFNEDPPGLISLDHAIYVAENGAGVDAYGVVFPESGIYLYKSEENEEVDYAIYITSITIPGYTGFPVVKTIPCEYMPEGYPKVEMGDVTVYEGVDVPFESVGSGQWASAERTTFELIIGEKYTVVWDGVEYKDLVAFNSDGEAAIGAYFNEWSDDMPFTIWNYGGGDMRTNSDAETHSVKITQLGEVVTPMDPKFLPSNGLVITEVEPNSYVANMDFTKARDSIISGVAPVFVRNLPDYQVSIYGFNSATTGVNYNFIEIGFNNGIGQFYLRFDSNGSIREAGER